VIVDVQNDFCPGGALAVPDGDAVIPVINRLAAQFAHVVLTQDWHPPGHMSFASSHPGKRPFETIEAVYGQQVLWPAIACKGLRERPCTPVLRSGMSSWFCAKAFGWRSIPIRHYEKTTGARPPGSRPICASAALSV
jgi:nicotinamidase/pyrazinamidase